MLTVTASPPDGSAILNVSDKSFVMPTQDEDRKSVIDSLKFVLNVLEEVDGSAPTDGGTGSTDSLTAAIQTLTDKVNAMAGEIDAKITDLQNDVSRTRSTPRRTLALPRSSFRRSATCIPALRRSVMRSPALWRATLRPLRPALTRLAAAARRPLRSRSLLRHRPLSLLRPRRPRPARNAYVDKARRLRMAGIPTWTTPALSRH